MKIVVLLKQILNPAGFVVRADLERIFVNVEDYIINPNDKNALEEALRLKDALGAEVIAISLGEPRAEDALREALAMGADSAILLTDEAFSKADASVATLILGKAIQKIGDYDLVLLGQRALDTGGEQLGPRLAEYLDLPQITNVRELSVSDGKVRAKRIWKRGYALVEASLPALLTIAPDSNEPRYPHGARIISAYREWEVEIWGAKDLSLTEEELIPLTEVRRKAFPPPREFGEKIRGTPKEAARDLVRYLKARKVVS
jgi:electron transfer flavoprotein beta subunit